MTGRAAMRVLVSVRSVPEAVAAAQAGVGFIDLKEPSAGALGGLPLPVIREVVQHLKGPAGIAPHTPISATIGDVAADRLPGALAWVCERVQQVAACGVDHVKVGVEPGPGATALVAALGRLSREGLPLVPVLIADHGVDPMLLSLICRQGFAAVMLDTADKRGGSLLQRMTPDQLAEVIGQVRAAGSLSGLAGALRLVDVPVLQRLGPDFAGFRSAVCAGDRAQGLDDERLRGLLAALGRPVARSYSGENCEWVD